MKKTLIAVAIAAALPVAAQADAVIPPLITYVKNRDLGSCQLYHWCDAV
tara:strand:+ start:765 stop:911 length:147 start_codon:yes stop_codon:yes gene_type:complete